MASTMPFLHTRKHEIDTGYLDWILKTLSEFDPWWKVAADGLMRRNKLTRSPKNGVHGLLSDLKCCSRKRDLQEGRRVHTIAVETGNDSNMFVAAALINMYAKCGSMVDARQVFDSIHEPDVVSWTVLILGYAENGEGELALEFFARMKTAGSAPNSVTYLAALKACTALAVHGDGPTKQKCLEQGRRIHLQIGSHSSHFVQNTLVDMYAKCGSMSDSQKVFDSLADPDVVSWNALIVGYAENGEGQAALRCFMRMKSAHGCAPNSVTYLGAIKACTSLAVHKDSSRKIVSLKHGREIHLEIGCHLTHFVRNTLVDMYAKCGSMRDARHVFHSIEKPDVVSWNALIMGYADNGEGQAALEYFSRMKNSPDFAPDSFTYVAAIKACTFLAAEGDESGKQESLKRGREIHSEVSHYMDQFVQSTLINMYAKSGSIVEAQRVFDSIQEPNVVSWTALILGYADNGLGQSSLESFSRMKASGGCPNSITYLAAIKACTSLAVNGDGIRKKECLERGRAIHSEIGHHMHHFVQSMLISMYSKCGSMVDAQQTFDTINEPNVVSWTSLIVGYVENGQSHAALDLFSRMKASSGCMPDSMTYIAAMKACVSIGALTTGRKFHSEITDFNVHVVTCLVDFYAKCGSIAEAREVFDSHSGARDITTWTALLAGYGSFGDIATVFNLFERMQDEGIRPNSVTFVCMLLGCSHAGLVDKAREYLEVMLVEYGITPNVMHYSCMVDVLGRANHLDEAVALLKKMPCNPDAVTWTALLGACRKWKNADIAQLAFQSLVDLDEKDATAYLLMAEIFGK